MHSRRYNYRPVAQALISLATILALIAPWPSAAFVDSRKYVAASSQYDSAADSASLSVTGNFTIEGWVKFASLPAANTVRVLYGKWVTAGNNLSYLVQLQDVSGTKSIRLINSSTGSNVGLASVNWTPSTATWYHLAVVFTASTHTMELFINGVSQGTAAGTLLTTEFDGTGIFTLAEDGDLTAGEYTDGQMFLMRVWSTTRTGSQLSTNQCTALGTTAGLSAEWSLDNVLTDNAGNSNTLTAHNTPTFTADIPSVCAAAAASPQPTFFNSFWW